MIPKIFFLLALCLVSFVNMTFAACTVDAGTSAAQFLSDCGSTTKGISPGTLGDSRGSIVTYITNIANAAISLGALLAVGAIVWAGIQYTKAYGDDEKLKKAKTTGIFALIGLVLLMASFGLVDVFINFLYTATTPN